MGARHCTLWANGKLGLMAFWWAESRQQQGRSVLTISNWPDLTVLDPRRLSSAQLSRAGRMFEHFRARTLLPANEAYRDETRRVLDRAVLVIFWSCRGVCLLRLKTYAVSGVVSPPCMGARAQYLESRFAVRRTTNVRFGNIEAQGAMPIALAFVLLIVLGPCDVRGNGAYRMVRCQQDGWFSRAP